MTFPPSRSRVRNFFAQGRLPPGKMNQTEERYALHLEREKSRGSVLWWKFEGITFKLGLDSRYTPDFVVLPADRVLECHEVKSHWQEDARTKIKVAASMFPFRFKAFRQEPKKRGGGYAIEDFSDIPSEKAPDLFGPGAGGGGPAGMDATKQPSGSNGIPW